MSLSTKGTPLNGPSGSSPAARSSASSNIGVTTALRVGLSRSIRVIAASTSSLASASLRRTSSAWAVASSEVSSSSITWPVSLIHIGAVYAARVPAEVDPVFPRNRRSRGVGDAAQPGGVPGGRGRGGGRSAATVAGPTQPVLLLHGEESFIVEEEARRTGARWRAELISEFGYEALDPSTLTAVKLREAILQVPFLDPYRVVVARGVQPRRADGLAPALADVPDSTRILITVSGRLTPSSRLVKAVLAAGGHVQEYVALKPRALQAWIFTRAKEYGLPVAAGAALVKLARSDLGVIDSELRKLAAYKAGGNELDQAAIDELVVAGRQDDIF